MNIVNNNPTSQTVPSGNISVKDLLDAYVSKISTVEDRLGGIERRLENSIDSINSDMRQDARFNNDNFKEIRKEISGIKKDLSEFNKELTKVDKVITDNLHEIEIDSKDADNEQVKQIKDLELKMLGIGAGSGTVTTVVLQVVLEIIKTIHPT